MAPSKDLLLIITFNIFLSLSLINSHKQTEPPLLYCNQIKPKIVCVWVGSISIDTLAVFQKGKRVQGGDQICCSGKLASLGPVPSW